VAITVGYYGPFAAPMGGLAAASGKLRGADKAIEECGLAAAEKAGQRATAHLHPVAHRFLGSGRKAAADPHDEFLARARQAERPARGAAVWARPQRANSGHGQSAGDALASVGRDRLAVEMEADRPAARCAADAKASRPAPRTLVFRPGTA
jgi:hypothetical protein